MLRWFLHQFQQGIKALRGDHMCFIENKDFVAITSRCKDSALTKISGIVNTIVTRSVDFDDVERAPSIAGEFNTAGAHTTWGVCGAFSTV
jgi:hypothetical protein